MKKYYMCEKGGGPDPRDPPLDPPLQYFPCINNTIPKSACNKSCVFLFVEVPMACLYNYLYRVDCSPLCVCVSARRLKKSFRQILMKLIGQVETLCLNIFWSLHLSLSPVPDKSLSHCVLASGAVHCNRSCLCVCGGSAGGVRTLLQPVRAQCLRL